jgi:hypothetical protein
MNLKSIKLQFIIRSIKFYAFDKKFHENRRKLFHTHLNKCLHTDEQQVAIKFIPHPRYNFYGVATKFWVWMINLKNDILMYKGSLSLK